MISVVDRLSGDGTFGALLARIRASAPGDGRPAGGECTADGLWGSFAPILAATAAGALRRPLLYVTAHLEQADEVRDDIELFCGVTPELLSAFETLPGEGAASDEVAAERIRLCARMRGLASNPPQVPSWVVVAPIQALLQEVPAPGALAAGLCTLAAGMRHDPREVASWLASHGYTRLDQVESPCDFALRGDILDVFAPGEAEPIRIDFFGDRIESIRRFDVSTQRSSEICTSVEIPAVASASGDMRSAEKTSFLAYLPPACLVAFAEPAEIQEVGRMLWERLGHPAGMMPVELFFRQTAGFGQLHLFALPAAAAENAVHFDVQSLARFETRAPDALRELAELAGRRDVLLYCDNEAERRRFEELWATTIGLRPESLQTAVGMLHRGFDWPGGGLAVVGHHELFHRYVQRRRMRRIHAGRPLESWLDLQPGDLVVHVAHGIARFRGMKTMGKGDGGKSEEYLTLEFADAATMHVPASQIDLVQKYIGAGTRHPPLSKLGGTRWGRTRQRVEESVRDLAADLLRVQAARAARPGVRYPPDTAWQREFEGSFIYTETPDQLAALEDIKRDMSRPEPMDRLLCGDVGYGKTELAMRAAFKTVEYGKQVAVLVPTTVLAEQHERTFRERFADYPFIIESLSRFKTARQQDDIVRRAARGQVDVLIGTHRLLSEDVSFKDLGLLIIDEEQRFGVEHKERLKRFRETVEVLTMSATPIPRTLHMAMIGIRDISSLATPPMDRRSIVTRVAAWDERLIREAIIRELNREGQAFFVHNLVHDIQTFADTVRRIVPEARILVGHGQMPERELERVMVRFVRHEADVLVCTTIIESGLDIPNCNTILIDQAERFGLSELHQLRGRVGRYKHRAYCYLLLRPDRPLSPTAARRLKAIEEYSDLGAGFRIAMRDLEIRGAGNILGPEQSGHIAAVGYELYCDLLERAVRRLREEPEPDIRPVHLELEVPAHIPAAYIDSQRQRMEVYRRLVRCHDLPAIAELGRDLKDAFGAWPPEVQTLLDLAEIRVLARPWRIRSINQQPPDLVFRVEELALVEPLFADSPGSARMADAHTVHLRLSPAYFEPATLLAVLRRLLRPREPASRMPV